MALPDKLGAYSIVRRIGQGAMGAVLLGVDDVGREVAIKTLPSSDPILLESFIREVEIIGRLGHPNIVRVVDTSGLRDAKPWYAMEYVSGPTLRDVIQSEHTETVLALDVDETLGTEPPQRTRANWRYLLEVLTGVFGGLNAIHALGVVHRDIKPGNIVIRDDDTAVLIDFGIAGTLHGTIGREKLSDYLGGSGTPSYAPAEQLRGDTVDARADIYSLGCILFEVCGGSRPYTGETYYELLSAHSKAPVPSVRERNPDIPADLDALIRWMLAKRPDARPGFVYDVDSELRRILDLSPPAYAPAQYVYHPEFVGRESEYGALKRLVRDTAENHASRLALVTGEAGIGKTRLLQELLVEADQRVQMVHVSAIDDEPAIVRAWERIRMGRTTLLPDLPAMTDPDAVPRMIACLREAADVVPVVAIFDDATELDGPTLNVLAAMCRGPIDGASVILAYRTDDDNADTFADLPVDLRLHLGPLSVDQLGRVIASMLALPQLPSRPRDLLMRQSAGNPFVAAEFVRWAIEDGTLVRTRGRWELLNDRPIDLGGDLPVPRRLGNMIFSRYARLGVDERGYLSALAICGDNAHPDFVRHVSAEHVAGEAMLARRGLVRITPESARFAHPTWGEVVRRATLPAQGVPMHARAAQWIATHGGTDAAFARHLVGSGDPLGAAHAFRRAADVAWSQMRYHDAATALMRSVEHLPPRTDAEWFALSEYAFADFDTISRGEVALFETLAKAALQQGRRDLQAMWAVKDCSSRRHLDPETLLATLHEARELIRHHGSVDTRVFVLSLLLIDFSHLGFHDAFQELAALLPDCLDPSLAIFGRHALATYMCELQQFGEALSYYAIDLPDGISMWVTFRHAFGYAMALGEVGEHEQSIALFRTSAEIAEAVGHTRLALTSRWNMANQYQHLGRWDKAGDILSDLLVASRVLPMDRLRLATFTLVATNASAEGLPRRADRYFERAHSASRNAPEMINSLYRNEAEHARRYGQLLRAERLLGQMQDSNPFDACIRYAQYAFLALARGEDPRPFVERAKASLDGFGSRAHVHAALQVGQAEQAMSLPLEALHFGEPLTAVPSGVVSSVERGRV